MLTCLFLGIPLPKDLSPKVHPPIVTTIFQGKTFLGVRSKAGDPLVLDDIDLISCSLQDFLYESVPLHYQSLYKNISLMIFPEILIGAPQDASLKSEIALSHQEFLSK